MKIEFVDLKRQNKLYKKELMRAIENIVDKATFIMGDVLDHFEEEFAAFCGRKYSIGLNSGTDALLFALLAYGIKPGDEVITAPNSYFSSAMVISQIGATPVFADVDPKSYNIDSSELEKKITNKTKAIIPVHLYGQAADMDTIVAIAKKYNLVIIEDCCQAHGTKYKGKSLPYTETGAFSFYPGKNLGAFGDGGAVVTDNIRIKEKLEYLRNDGSKEKYSHITLGFKSRLDTLQAAVLLVKIKYLKQFVQQRRNKAKLYNAYLKNIRQVILPKELPYGKHAYHIYAIQAKNRDKLQDFLRKSEISTVIHYPTPIHLQKAYASLGFNKGDFPITEKLSQNILSLPIFPELEEKEIGYIAKKIKEFYFRNKS